MRFLRAEHMGLCYGVRRALAMTESALLDSDAVCAIGEPIHNPREVDRLRSLGLNVVSEACEVRTGTIVLRAHGSPPQTYTDAQERGLCVVDVTCPYVKAAQEAARSLSEQGYCVVIVGDCDHPEIRALKAWAGPKSVVVADAHSAKTLPGTRFGVVSQTTADVETVESVVATLEQKAEVKHVNTICSATSDRQQAVKRLAEKVSVMIVVGGRNSANTRRLVQIAERQGAKAYLVEHSDEIAQSWLHGQTVIGVAAGASTPDWIIKEVVDVLEEIEKQPTPQPEAEEAAELSTETVEPEAVAEQQPQQEAIETPEAEEAAIGAEQDEACVETDAEEAPISEEAQIESDVESLEASMELPPPPAVGDILEVIVVSVDDSGAMVDAGFKSEGIIDRRELSRRADTNPADIVKKGDTINAMVLSLETGEGSMKLSKRRADESLAWNTLKEALDSGETIEAPVTRDVKGGLEVDVGVRGFVPASQVERGFASDLSKYVGQTLALKLIELDKSKNRVILSRRAALEEEAEELRKAAWERLQEGDTQSGTVKSLTDFGAFVDLGGVDGLLHVSELSWGRVKHPSEMLTVGQEIEVKILRLDPERGRISLGHKQTLPDPWTLVAEKYIEGSIVHGTVTRIAPFGAFVELEDGVEGLVHISEMANRRVQSVEEVVEAGQEVDVKVLHVRPTERRISLSLREAEPPAPAKEAKPRREAQPEPEPERLTLGDVIGDKLLEAFESKPEKE